MFVNIDRIPEFFHSDFSLYVWLEELCDKLLLYGTEYDTPRAQVFYFIGNFLDCNL